MQFELFADVISAGEHLEAIIDPADADARPSALVQELTSVLAARVGRVVFDAYPTGVAVSWAMQHGGPYPATTSRTTRSVGLTSTRRFMRPVCWQNAPAVALPAPLRDENPSGIWGRIDGVLTTASVAAAGKERG